MKIAIESAFRAISTWVTDQGHCCQVIARAKEIGAGASRLALGGASLVADASDTAQAQIVCEQGKRCADAAGTVVYTAKVNYCFLKSVCPYLGHTPFTHLYKLILTCCFV